MNLDLSLYVSVLRRWWWLLLSSALVGGVSVYLYTRNTADTYYQATTTLLAQPGSASSGGDPGGDLYAGPLLAKAYQEVLTNETVLRQARASLAGRFQSEELNAASADAAVKRDSRILAVTGRAPNPELAVAFAQAVASTFTIYMEELQRRRFQGLMRELETQFSAPQASLSEAIKKLETLQANKEFLSPEEFRQEQARLQQQVAVERDTVDRLQANYTNVRIASALYQTNLIPIGETSAASRIEPPALRNGTLVGLGALFVALTLALLLDHLRDRPRNIATAAAALEMNILASIPHVRRAAHRTWPLPTTRSGRRREKRFASSVSIFGRVAPPRRSGLS